MPRLQRWTRACLAGAALAAALLPTTAARAQPLDAPPSRGNAIAINPLGVAMEAWQLELERRLTPRVTAAIAASRVDGVDNTGEATAGGAPPGSVYSDEGEHFTTIEAKLRLYPWRRALAGFSLGSSVGYTWLRDRTVFVSCPAPPDPCQASEGVHRASSPAVGISLEYNWLVAPGSRLLLGIGAGGKWLLRDHGNPSLPRGYPTARLATGWTF